MSASLSGVAVAKAEALFVEVVEGGAYMTFKVWAEWNDEARHERVRSS